MVGSIDTSEFVVAVGGSLGFILALGSQGINWGYAGALLAMTERDLVFTRRMFVLVCRRPGR